MERVSEGPTHRFGAVGNVLVCVYWGAPEAEALRARIPWVERTIRRYDTVGLLVVVTRDAGGQLPDRAFRDESRAQAERFEGRIAFSASVIEGDDVRHSLIRTFLRGLSLVAGRGVTVRFFEDVADGARWAAEQAATPDVEPAELVDAVQSLRP